MKKIIISILAAILLCMPAVMQASAIPAPYSAGDWKPHNYVLTEGFGMNAKKVSIRTYLDYADGALKVFGNTSKGGVGVTFDKEIDLSNFSVEMSLDKWQVNSTDKWFGISFMDKAARTDIYNEVPFYSKHSESWSNDYGAGTLTAWRPFAQDGANAQPGVLQIQFNNIGIKHTYSDIQAGILDPDAGKYADGVLGWSGYLSTIQLCNTDWTPMTDYSKVKVSVREITTENGKGYAFDFNGGYYYRTDDSIVWPTVEGDPALFDQLDIDGNSAIDEWERKLFKYGPAYSDSEHGETYNSWVPYANWGDPLYSLYNFNQIVKNAGGKLYFNAMYKDAFNMPEGENAQFTITKLNGAYPTQSETSSLTASKTVDANGIKAELTETNLYAGVYPSMVTSIKAVTVEAAKYSAVQEAINGKKGSLGVNSYECVNFFGQASVNGTDKNVSIISSLQIEYDIAGKENFAVYKVTGTDIDAVQTTIEGTKAAFTVKDSASIYVMFYKGASKGCGGTLSGLPELIGAAVFVFAAAALKAKAKKA